MWEGEVKSTNILGLEFKGEHRPFGVVGGGRVFVALVKSTHQILVTYMTYNMPKS